MKPVLNGVGRGLREEMVRVIYPMYNVTLSRIAIMNAPCRINI
jgi:hypothetical protein